MKKLTWSQKDDRHYARRRGHDVVTNISRALEYEAEAAEWQRLADTAFKHDPEMVADAHARVIRWRALADLETNNAVQNARRAHRAAVSSLEER